jgi:hypothetical protein
MMGTSRDVRRYRRMSHGPGLSTAAILSAVEIQYALQELPKNMSSLQLVAAPRFHSENQALLLMRLPSNHDVHVLVTVIADPNSSSE